MKKIFGSPLFSGSVLMVGGSLGANFINYFYHLVMGRVLGPADYGVLASAFALLYVISIVPQSASFAIVKFVSAAKSKKELAGVYVSLRKFVFWLSLILSLIVVVISPAVAEYMKIENIMIIALMSVVLFLSLNTLVMQATLQGVLNFWGATVPVLVSSVGKFVLGLVLVMLGWGVYGAVVGIVLTAILTYFVAKYAMRSFDFGGGREAFGLQPFLIYSLPVLVQALAFTSMFTMDIILVKHYLPEFDTGLYAALSTLGKIIYFAVQPVAGVMFPIVSKRRSGGESYRQVFYIAFLMAAVGASGIVGLYYLFPELAIGVLYGKAYLVAASELVWMGMFISIYTLSYMVVSFLLSIGRTKIVILPMLAAIVQVVLIRSYHGSVLEVIQVSLMCVLGLFVGLGVYLGYYQVGRIYASKK